MIQQEDDESQALHYFSESYRYLPTNLETISWLGIYYVKHDLYERACHFFERASQIQSKELKWKLMVASCYRRMGSYQKALTLYENINNEDPNNIECLRFLVQLCKEMGLPYEMHAANLNKLLRLQQDQFQEQNNFNFEDDGQYDQQNNYDQGDHVTVNIKKNQNTRMIQKNKNENDDDWANQEDVDDLLV